MTDQGAFAFRSIPSRRFGLVKGESGREGNELLIVSHLPRSRVFETSNNLLSRLLTLVLIVTLPLFIVTRYWALATVRRRQQNRWIASSELRIRELSSRLLRIQEEERKYISREIHDQLGQQVTAINLGKRWDDSVCRP